MPKKNAEMAICHNTALICILLLQFLKNTRSTFFSVHTRPSNIGFVF